MENSGKHVRTVVVGPGDGGARLDKFLSAAAPDLSRTRVKSLIQADLVATIDPGAEGVPTTLSEPSYRVKPGQTLRLTIPAPDDPRPEAQALALTVVHEDDHLIVIDKPAGLVVHPAPGNPDRTLVNALLAHCGPSLSGIGGVRRPGIVHRLDKDTSGLLVAAKTDLAHRALAEQFARHAVERAYTAVVWGVLRPPAGKVSGSIGRDPRHRRRMAMVDKGGKPSVTHYRTARTLGGTASVVECRLETGRTHQIRVHMTSLGHPVVGDPLYGGRRPGKGVTAAGMAALGAFNRQALHAGVLGFDHPDTGKRLNFTAPLPNEMMILIYSFE
jgi:23S rRNA pseudouridine1911/1915/1917 synthase